VNLTGLLACLAEDPGFAEVAELARSGSGQTVETPSPMHALVVAQIARSRSSSAPVVVVTASAQNSAARRPANPAAPGASDWSRRA